MIISMVLLIIYWEVSIVTIKNKRRQRVRTVEEYMTLPYKMEIVSDTEDGGYVVYFPDLPGCTSMGDLIEAAIGDGTKIKE